MQDYAFTVKYNKPCEDIEAKYTQLFTKWGKYGVLIKYREKHTDKPIIHYHGLMTAKKSFWLKKLVMDGFHVKILTVYDYDGWNAYCNKQHINIVPNLFKPNQGSCSPTIQPPKRSMFQ